MKPCEATLATTPHGRGYKMRYTCPCGSPTNPEACPRTRAIKAEHDRRAKAYPKLCDALRQVIKCAQEWHEPEAAGDKKAYLFDLSDHPRMKGPIALLRKLEEEGKE